jgi:transposase
MGSTRRRFTPEYKQSAVEFVIEGQRSLADVARSLGINSTTLGRWVDQEKKKNPPEPAELAADERVELEALRKENQRLKMELEFAKKVATWFANEKQ